MKGKAMKKRVSLILKIAAVLFVTVRLGGYVVADKSSDGLASQLAKNERAKNMHKKLTTNMMVDDVNRTVDFYSNVLGFDFVMGVPEDSQEIVTAMQNGQALGFAMVKCENVEMMFQTKKSLAREIPEFSGMKIGGSLTFYVQVEDVEGLFEKLKDKVTIIKGMQTTFYGMREFYIQDCNGYVLAFAQGA
jgi:uncharacterized glyoxalase superfamily protein PhnB